ncbi:MAG: flagellar filament capping protein FliD [Candidatus Krumholzibacteria bacterium]|nr:flagellar filament capping protein FliD [Candidatus Krumholzibacteria bacterium]
MSSVSFSGLATGLDTASIVAQLVEIRRRPVYRLENRLADFQKQLTALSTLKTKLLALQEAGSRLDTVREFNALAATSTNDGILTATAGPTAAPGSYDIIVQSLATARKDISQGYSSPDDTIGEGTVWFSVGGGSTPLMIEAGTTLAEFKDLINNSVDGVSASLINDGSDGDSYYLVLRGENEGTAGDFNVNASALNGGTPPVLTNTQAATDAQLTIDGIAVTAGSNQPDDVISGLTLNLLDADPGTTVRIQVDMDGTEVEESIKALVDTYNDLFSFIQEQAGPDGDLHGHPTLRSVANRLENIFTSPLEGGLGSLSMLWEVGITMGEDRQLLWDSSKFQTALQADFSGVRDLFIEREGNLGKGYLINAAINNMTDSVSGLFKISTDALNNKIRSTDQTIERYERGIESYRMNLEIRFTAMERMVAQLQAQGSYLGSLYL